MEGFKGSFTGIFAVIFQVVLKAVSRAVFGGGLLDLFVGSLAINFVKGIVKSNVIFRLSSSLDRLERLRMKRVCSLRHRHGHFHGQFHGQYHWQFQG
jgi:hypothetical protein